MSSHHSSHRHSHHNTSHSRRHRKISRGSDVKAYRKTRYFFAFLLFLTVTVLSFGITARATVLSPSRTGDIFTNPTYTRALYEDVRTYAEDMCRRNSVPLEALDGTVTYSGVSYINESYILGTLSLDEQYSDTVYLDNLDKFSAALQADITASLKQNDIAIAKGQQNGPARLAENITQYLSDRMSFAYFEKWETVLNLGGTASLIAVAVSAVLTAVLVLIVIAMGSEVYRNLRSVCHAVSAAAMTCYLTGLVYLYISKTKALGFYPAYFSDSLLRFFSGCVGGLMLTGGILTVLAFAVAALVWKLKSDALDMMGGSSK